MTNRDNLRSLVLSGLFWKFGERIIAQGVSFLISLILARLLMPDDYGLISMVLVFINIANVFVNEGLGAALIQKKTASDVDFSTMFYCAIGISVILYALLFVASPVVADFYGNDQLVIVLRVLSLQIPLSAIKTIQHSYVSRNLLFKKFFFSTLVGTIISGLIGIFMAYKGFGVWALIEQYLVNSIIDMIVLFFTVKWRPHLVFNLQSAKEMFSYSWKLLVAGLINKVYDESRNLIIGKVYTSADLAYNSKGNQFPSLLINNINTAISSVLFPALSKSNGDTAILKSMTRKSLQVTSFIIFPLMVGLAAVAKPLVILLLTTKWIQAVPYLQIYCAYWLFQPCLTANNQAIKASGRSDICLKLEIIKKIVGVVLIASTMFISVKALALSNVLFALISMIVNMSPNKKIMNYGIGEQIKDMMPALLISLTMGIVVWSISLFNLSYIAMLVLQVVFGILIYISLSKLFKLDAYNYVLSVIKNRFAKSSN